MTTDQSADTYYSDAEIKRRMSDPALIPPSSLLMGYELIDLDVTAGWAEMAFNPPRSFSNPLGSVQGGFVTAMLDDAMGVAARAHSRLTKVFPTLQLTVAFLRPTPFTRLICRGEVVRAGQTAAVLEGRLMLPDRTILATGLVSAAVRDLPEALRAVG